MMLRMIAAAVLMSTIPSFVFGFSNVIGYRDKLLTLPVSRKDSVGLHKRMRRTRSLETALEVATSSDMATENTNLPELGNDGVYHILNEAQHRALLEAFPDKLVVMKVFAPWCRACKGLEPKFNAVVRDKKYKKVPIIWADLTIQHNKDYIKKIGVLALPTIQFYANAQRMDTFPCGPSKVPILKRKLAQFINENVDATTFTVKPIPLEAAAASSSALSGEETSQDQASALPGIQQQPQPTQATLSLAKIIEGQKSKIRNIPFFQGMLESEFENVLSKANVLTFESGNIIMREGNDGRTFYFIVDGEVEICQKTSFEDPLTTPPTYLGTVINRFETGDYFGERALITGEPRAASIRAAARTVCLSFDKEVFPATCVLSGRSPLNEEAANMAMMNERYGVSLYDMTSMNDQQYLESVKATQVRGSVNNPREIDGVDNDRDFEADVDMSMEPATSGTLGADPETIVRLLLRFKLIRLITRCFDYIVANRLRFGEAGARKRRMMLVNLLSIGQQAEIRDAYALIDADGDGEITLMELRRLLDSVGEARSDKELVNFIETSHQGMIDQDDGKQVITYADFFGIMAEVEFYHLFLETFRALDARDSGFVRAKDLDRVLCGIRDLVTDDRRSIIDVDDKDMMVDYEQFSRMLLGSAL